LSADKVKIALLGLSDEALAILGAALEMNCFELVAVSDREMEKAQRLGERYACRIFDDPRQMVLSSGAELIVVASRHQCSDEFVKTAFHKGVSILKTLPTFHNLEQAAATIALAETCSTFYVSASLHRYYPGYKALDDYLYANRSEAETIYLIEARGKYSLDLTLPENHWLKDPELAGGGVLLRHCHAIFHLLTRHFALPETVFAIKTNNSPDIVQRNLLAEDFAVVSMQYSERLIAGLTVTRGKCREMENIRLYFPDKYISVRPQSFRLRTFEEELLSEVCGPVDKTNAIKHNLLLIYNALKAEDDEVKALAARTLTERENELLNTIAVVEAAYLSAKTQNPEMPDKMMELCRLNLSLQ